MSKIVRRFTIEKTQGTPQPCNMPKRAHVLSAFAIGEKIALDAEVWEDEDTRVFDRAHQRYFQVVTAGELIPEGGLVASLVTPGNAKQVQVLHVYEVRGR